MHSIELLHRLLICRCEKLVLAKLQCVTMQKFAETPRLEFAHYLMECRGHCDVVLIRSIRNM